MLRTVANISETKLANQHFKIELNETGIGKEFRIGFYKGS